MFRWLKNIFTKRSLENPNTPINSPWGGVPSLAGVAVNEHTALSYNAVWACVNRISTDVGGLGYQPYEITQQGKSKAINHWSHQLIHVSPDGVMTAENYFQTKINHRCRYGNSFSAIRFNKQGFPFQLDLLDPERMLVHVRNRALVYQYLGDDFNDAESFLPWQIIHLRGMSHNGRVGLSPIRCARDSIGIGMAGDIATASWLGNSSQPGGTLEFPPDYQPLSEQAKKQLREVHEALYSGPSNKGRLMHLYGGTKYNTLQLPAPDQNFIASRQWSIQDCCRWFGIDPPIIGDYSKSTYSNVEQATISYMNKVVRPEAEKLCAELNLKLFVGTERGRYSIRPNYHNLLRADAVARAAFYASGRQWGWLNVNDIMELEDKNYIGEEGEIYLSPSNMIPTQQLLTQIQSGQQVVDPVQSALASIIQPRQLEHVETSKECKEASKDVIKNELNRLMRREANALKRASNKPDFQSFIESFYEEHSETMTQQISTPLRAYQLTVNKQGITPEQIASDWCQRSENELFESLEMLLPEQLPQAIEQLTTAWETRINTIMEAI
jgi:HK97 family phage portal protein